MVTTISPPPVPVPLVADPSDAQLGQRCSSLPPVVAMPISCQLQRPRTCCRKSRRYVHLSASMRGEVLAVWQDWYFRRLTPILLRPWLSSWAFSCVDGITAQQFDDAGFRVQSFSTFLGIRRGVVWLSCQFFED